MIWEMVGIWFISAIFNMALFYFLDFRKKNFIASDDLLLMAAFIVIPVLNSVIAGIACLMLMLEGVEWVVGKAWDKINFNWVWKDGKFQRMEDET
jgi:hypothetical protein